MIDLKTAKVIVTGGSEGVGLEMARALVQRGAEVTVIARGHTSSVMPTTLEPAVSLAMQRWQQ